MTSASERTASERTASERTASGRTWTVPVGRALRAPKTAELIAGDLRGQIVRGVLKPGQTLPPETQLMEQYQVSRPTLREAFRILEAETLITVRRGARGGAQVMTPDLSVAARYVGLLLQIQGTTIDDVFEARMVAEPVCARLLARRRTRADLADLGAIVERLRQLADEIGPLPPDPDRWSRLTFGFHELVVQRCGNRTLAVQAAVLQDIAATHLQATVAQTFGGPDAPNRLRQVIRSYDKLLRLVEERDAEGAETHWRRHMEQAARFLLNGDGRSRPVVELFG